jgi:hypothetical protein
MANVSETIQEALQSEVGAALSWFNATQDEVFRVTGIMDAHRALAADVPRELQLVLCGVNTCQQKSFRVTRIRQPSTEGALLRG